MREGMRKAGQEKGNSNLREARRDKGGHRHASTPQASVMSQGASCVPTEI